MEINNKNIGYYIYFLITITLILIRIFYPWSEVEYNFQRPEVEQGLHFLCTFGLFVSFVIAIVMICIFILKCNYNEIEFNYKLALPFSRKSTKTLKDIEIEFFEKQLQEYIKREDLIGQKECLERLKILKG